MLRLLFDAMFGCRHRNLSRVFTLFMDGQRRSYQVCLQCGREIAYDWGTMQQEKGTANSQRNWSRKNAN